MMNAKEPDKTPGTPLVMSRKDVLSDFRKIVGDRRPDRAQGGSPKPQDASADPLRSPREPADA